MKRAYLRIGEVQHEIGQGNNHIGRAADCPIRLYSDTWVSRYHCNLDWDGQRLIIRDLGSRNGTWLKNSDEESKQIESAELKDGDVISVGASQLTVVIVDTEPPLESPTTALESL